MTNRQYLRLWIRGVQARLSGDLHIEWLIKQELDHGR